jgi:hypothetical protein
MAQVRSMAGENTTRRTSVFCEISLLHLQFLIEFHKTAALKGYRETRSKTLVDTQIT